MLDKLKTAVVLVIIGGLSGLLIYFVNDLTEQIIIDNRIAIEEGYYMDILGIDDDVKIDVEKIDLDGAVDQEVVIRELVSNDLIGIIYRSTDSNNYGTVTVLVGIFPDGTIADVIISNTSNTPTFVSTIKKEYIGNFKEQEITNYSIDSKTGATFTYTSVVTVVENAAAKFAESWGE
jgi:Na+-translocating ferredoxin:NAD+ oxidoreductase RnfG subunit